MKVQNPNLIDMNKARFKRAERAMRKQSSTGTISVEESCRAVRDMLISIGARLHEKNKPTK